MKVVMSKEPKEIKSKYNKAEYDKNYVKNNVKRYTLGLNKEHDAELIEFLDAIPNKAEFFKKILKRELLTYDIETIKNKVKEQSFHEQE